MASFRDLAEQLKAAPVSVLLTASLLVLSVFFFSRHLLGKKQNATSTQHAAAGDSKTSPHRDVTSAADDLQATISSINMDAVHVSKILIHPIKSCRGVSVPEARYTPQGLENDRRWCIIDANTNIILTARELPAMVLVAPQVKPNPSSSTDGELVISFPEDSGAETFSVPLHPTADMLSKWKMVDKCSLFGEDFIDGAICESPAPSRSPSEILSQYLKKPVYLVMKGPRPRDCAPTLAYPGLKATALFQDGYPLLVASEESLAYIAHQVRDAAHKARGEPGWVGGLDTARWRTDEVVIERFRPNIVVAGAGVPFAEDMWREAILGDPATADSARTLTLVSKCTRCLLPNIDTRTGVRDAAVPYKVLMKFRTGKDPARLNKPCFGCNSMFGGAGVVRVGDRISVKTWAGAGGV